MRLEGGNLGHPRHSPSPKQKALNGRPKSTRTRLIRLHERKPEGRISRKERSLSFWKTEINHSQFSFCDGRLQTSFWLFFFLLVEFQTSLFQPTFFLSTYREGSGGTADYFNFFKISCITQDTASNTVQQLLSLLSVMIRIESLTLSFLKGYLPSMMCLENFF